MATAGGGGGGGGVGVGSAGGGGGGGPNTGRGNISVTSINCENVLSSAATVGVGAGGGPTGSATGPTGGGTGNANGSASSGGGGGGSLQLHANGGGHFYGNGGIRISVPKMEDSDESDTELSNIEKSMSGTATTTTSSSVCMRSSNDKGPRPMSWEGELSEPDDMMDAEGSSASNSGEQLPAALPTSEPHTNAVPPKTGILLPKEENGETTVKPEFISQVDATSAGSAFAEAGHKVKYMAPNLDVVNLKFEPGLAQESAGGSSVNSPLLARSKTALLPANPSPDSAIHSVYTHSSPSQSPLTSRHAPYTPSLSRNNSDASHSSCYSYSSEFSPTHSPIQGRHHMYGAATASGSATFNGSPLHHSVLFRPMTDSETTGPGTRTSEDGANDTDAIPAAGISRQQLINSPCPICGDRISGFHYGIFSCESCKGFFKRTVQNRKNYVCLRGAACPVTIATRKKCPACRFEKCLQRGMKLEAIREDRTRGGRSTYQCSYTLPGSMLSPFIGGSGGGNGGSGSGEAGNPYASQRMSQNGPLLKVESHEGGGTSGGNSAANNCTPHNSRPGIPQLLQEIMDVEHLWQYNEAELSRLHQPAPPIGGQSNPATNPLLASTDLSQSDNTNPDLIANLCNIADHRLYKIVKWCKSLPLFKNISIDDQICLLINSWCELLLFSCCYRSISTPGEIRISLGKSITLTQAKSSGLQSCIERMLNLTDHLRRLRVDKYEYVAMKVIVLLQSDTSELREPEKVRTSQEKALQALQAYTLAHYPDSPAKFGELLLRIPELQRTCQVGKEMLTIKSKDGEEFNLLMELLRGEH